MSDPKFPTLEERWKKEAEDGPLLQVVDDDDAFLESDDDLELGDDEDED